MVHYISCFWGLLFPTLLNSPMVRSIAGKVMSGPRFNATQEVKNGGVWKDSTLCRRRFGVKHSNQNQETHQITQWKMHWKHCGAIVGVGQFVWVVGSLLRSGVLERYWVVACDGRCFRLWHWVGLWGSLRSITVGQFNKLHLLTDSGEGRGALQLNGCKQLPWLVVACPVVGWGP